MALLPRNGTHGISYGELAMYAQSPRYAHQPWILILFRPREPHVIRYVYEQRMMRIPACFNTCAASAMVR